MTVTFCGHADFYGSEDVRVWLKETVEGLIRRGADDFLLGGYGRFDACAASVVWELKKQYPAIRSTLVLPYLDRKVDATKYRPAASCHPAGEQAVRGQMGGIDSSVSFISVLFFSVLLAFVFGKS